MNQPIATLDLPEYLIEEFNAINLLYCDDIDVNDDTMKSKISASEWNKLNSVPKTKTALDIYHDECLNGSIPTLIKELDEAIGGGVAVGKITEFYGEAGAGKTQMCLQLSVNAQLPLWCGGTSGEIVYVSTNFGFSSERLREFAEVTVQNYLSAEEKQISNEASSSSQNLNIDSVLKRIFCISLIDCIELLAFTRYLKKWLTEHSTVRLVIIDNISSPLKQTDPKERNFIIGKIFNDLQILANQYNFAIVLTNDMTTQINPDGSVTKTPSLGTSYYHRINTRIRLSKNTSSSFKATIIKSVFCDCKEIDYELLC